MHFSLGQSSDRLAILRNLLEMHLPFPAKRPSDAEEDQVLGSPCDPAEVASKEGAIPLQSRCAPRNGYGLRCNPAESTQKQVNGFLGSARWALRNWIAMRSCGSRIESSGCSCIQAFPHYARQKPINLISLETVY